MNEEICRPDAAGHRITRRWTGVRHRARFSLLRAMSAMTGRCNSASSTRPPFGGIPSTASSSAANATWASAAWQLRHEAYHGKVDFDCFTHKSTLKKGADRGEYPSQPPFGDKIKLLRAVLMR